MAATAFDRGGGNGSTSITTSSFTPGVGEVLIAFFGYRRNTSFPVKGTISDTLSLTWTEVSDATYSTGVDPRFRFTVWKAVGTGQSMTVTVTSSDAAVSGLAVNGFTGISGNFGTVATGTSSTGDPSATISAPLTNSAVVGGMTVNSSTQPSPPSGFTEIGEYFNASFPTTVEVAWNDTSPGSTMAWSTAAGRGMCAVFEMMLDYPITASAASFALTGVSAGVLAARSLACDVGSYSLTGIDAGVLATRTTTAASGTFALTGNNVNLLHNLFLAIGTGAFTLTGVDAAFGASPVLVGDVGSFSLTPTTTSLLATRLVNADVGTFALVSPTTSLTRALYLTSDLGTFTLSGIDSGLTPIKLLQSDAGSFLYVGQSANLSQSAFTAFADTGSFILLGKPAGSLIIHKIVASPNDFIFIGGDAQLRSGQENLLLYKWDGNNWVSVSSVSWRAIST